MNDTQRRPEQPQSEFEELSFEGFYSALTRNNVSGGNILRGEIPHLYVISEEAFALMTASVELRASIFLVLGGTGVADVIYLCRKNAADTYEFDAIN